MQYSKRQRELYLFLYQCQTYTFQWKGFHVRGDRCAERGQSFFFDFSDSYLTEFLQVLAFEEIPSSKSSSSPHNDSTFPQSVIHARSQSQPMPSDQRVFNGAPPIKPKRARAPSDPFLDTPAMSRSTTSYSSQSANTTALLSGSGHDGFDEPPSPIYEDHVSSPPRGDFAFDDSEEDYMRVWTSPDLPDPELLELLKLFPSFVSRRPLPRFPPSSTRHADIEEGEGDDEGLEGKQIHFGTGSIWVSSKQRSDWNEGWWSRFILWWRTLFC